jgi:plastocyanin
VSTSCQRGRALGALAGALAALAPAAAAAAPPTVSAGPPIDRPPRGVSPQADLNAFFPSTVSIHAGQRVRFVFNGFHDVTFFGRLGAPPLAAPTGRIEAAATDAAGAPFWWSGRAPVLGVNRLVLLPRGGNTVLPGRRVGSGLQRLLAGTAEPPPFVVSFPRIGDYVFACSVHPGMRGVVHVLPERAAVSSSSDVGEIGGAQLRGAVASLRILPRVRPTAPRVVAVGVAAGGAELLAMSPRRLTVRAGRTVTFRNLTPYDLHTVTFGPASLRERVAGDFLGPRAGSPVPVFDPLGIRPSERPGTRQPIAYSGRNHGDGYLNSGILFPAGTPARVGPTTFRVRFTRPGSYDYDCVIHPRMEGTIVVR